MYKLFIRPLLFLFRAEQARKIVIFILGLFNRIPVIRSFIHSLYSVEHESLEREVFGVRFRNPVGVAAGLDINADAVGVLGAMGFGFVEVGAITPEASDGNRSGRIFRLDEDGALVQNFGHPNRGLGYAIDKLRRRSDGVVVGCNIASSESVQLDVVARDYQKSFRNLYQYVDYFTVCIDYSILNCEDKASAIKTISQLLEPLYDFRRGQNDYRPILIKVSPDLSDEMINAVSNVLITTPLDGVVAVSGTLQRRNPLLSSPSLVNRTRRGAMSGSPLNSRALEVVRMLHKKSGGAYPIIGVGGIMTADDVRAMMDAGASLVQLYTGLVYEGPTIAGQICLDLIEQHQEE